MKQVLETYKYVKLPRLRKLNGMEPLNLLPCTLLKEKLTKSFKNHATVLKTT